MICESVFPFSFVVSLSYALWPLFCCLYCYSSCVFVVILYIAVIYLLLHRRGRILFLDAFIISCMFASYVYDGMAE